MSLDRRIVAAGFLLLALVKHSLISAAALGGAPAAVLPYAALLLASLSIRRRAAVWGGGLALVLGEAASFAVSLSAAQHLAERSADPLRMAGWMMIPTLLGPPASAVFVLPVGMAVGAWMGRRFGWTEDLPTEARAGAARDAARVGNAAAVAGAAIVLATNLMAGSFNPGLLAFAVWALLPYGLLVLAARAVRDPWAVAGAGSAALAAEIGIRAAVFLYPRGSTAAIALVFSPALISAVFLPAGAAAGWALGRVWRACGPVGRAATGLVSAGALGLIVLGLARPELFPTAVARRRAALRRIGVPRVVKGVDAFEKLLVLNRAAWHVAGDFDGVPGDEIAVVDHDGATLLDPVDFHERGRADFRGEAGRLWNWYSTLAPLDGRLVVVQTGGGYSATEVRGLDGRLVWSYRPDPRLPPTALKPADLDGDGRLEFYASHHQATVRLDGDGREVWKRPTRGANLVAVAPRSTESPAWVVGSEYPSVVKVWDESGRALAEMPYPKEGGVVDVVDWPEKRALLLGGTAPRGLGLDGATLFELPPGDFALSQALAVRPWPGARAHLALVAAAPRDVERWQVRILSPEREVVYDEVLASTVRLLKARRADGGETLLLSGDGLRVVRPLRK